MKSLGSAVFVPAASVIIDAQAPAVDVTIARGRRSASVRAEMTEPYAGGPWAAIPASCMNDSPQARADAFRIRVWREAEAVRVVVFSVVADATTEKKERESQISTFLLPSGQSVNVTQAAQIQRSPIHGKRELICRQQMQKKDRQIAHGAILARSSHSENAREF